MSPYNSLVLRALEDQEEYTPRFHPSIKDQFIESHAITLGTIVALIGTRSDYRPGSSTILRKLPVLRHVKFGLH